jgi:membrane protein
LTYAAAVAFQTLLALVPLTLLVLALLGALGRGDVWRSAILPQIARRVRPTLASALDDAATRILAHGSGALLAFGALLALWYIAAAMRAVTEALDRIHDVAERRSGWRRARVALALAALAEVAFVAAAVFAGVARRGELDAPDAVRWLVACALLLLVVALTIRYAPAERAQARWVSAGALLIVAFWVATTFAFKWYVTSLANFRSATGQLTTVLVVTGYLFASSLIFLLGAQLDESLRARRGDKRRRR